MIDEDVRTALQERFPTPSDVDLLPGLQLTDRPRRLRVVLAIAASVLVVAAVTVVLALRPASQSHPAAFDGDGLVGITWGGSGPSESVVFARDWVRTYDGCTNELREVTIAAGSLDIGKTIGVTGTCSGLAHVPGMPTQISIFDRVMNTRHLAWQVSDGTLRLTDPDGGTLVLHDQGPALSVTGQNWTLERFTDARAETHEGDYTAARLRIEDSAVRASDLCRTLIGSATVTDTTISFAHMAAVEGPSCSLTAAAEVASAVTDVLSGTVRYAIRGDELMIYADGGNQMLVYRASV